MVVKQIGYESDTCGCIIIWDYDDSAKTFSLNSYIKTCVPHQNLLDNNNRYSIMIADNNRKNLVLGRAVSNISGFTAVNSEKGTITLRDDITFNWEFSGSGDTRVLTISFTGITITIQQKTSLQNIADSTFGVGKVIIL